ncbi:hypothetical protein FRB99_004787 [Tulasnella sp. 403]|nr:hypothetical protein FRB99_004787 [Tulasnella sp. 403]
MMSSKDAPNSLHDIFPDAGSSSTQSSYLTHITSLSLPQILQEPATLASEASFLTSELTNLCHSQYKTFLSLHTASTALSSSFSSFSTSLSALIDAVPLLEAQCTAFAQETRELRKERRNVTTVLEQHEKLLDILEIPQLIDTCVKNGYYQEALDLSAHTTALVKRFPNVPIIRSVEAEVAGSINQMHSQLLQLLQEPAKLPSLLKAVNFLRRMGVLDEEELALAFLTSRGAYMQGLFEAIERERTMDVSRFLKKWIDLWREGVYDVVTQFTSIFLERPAPTSSSTLPPDLRPFLTAFTHTLVQQLLQVLSRTVPQITDSPALSSLLTQLSYCSSSFARIGLDFRALFPPIFEKAVLENFKTGIEDACGKLNGALEKAQGSKRGTAVKLPSTWFVVQDAVMDPPRVPLASADGASAFIPSSVLTSYPPLALLTNALLTTLNSLRLLAPVSLMPQLLAFLDQRLDETSTILLGYLQSCISRPRRSFDMNDSNEATEREKAIILAVARAWVYVVRFVRRGLVEGVYGKNLGDAEATVVRRDGRKSVDWSEWEAWLRSVGETDLLRYMNLLTKVNGAVKGEEVEAINGVENGSSGDSGRPSAENT